MKTLLIQLEDHDDLISIRDRMSWAKTPRIILVWPHKGRVDVRPLDLTLLRRHAETLGAQLAIVTHEGGMRAAARQQGIAAFRTTTQAQRKTWPENAPARPQRRAPRPDLRALRTGLPWLTVSDYSRAERIIIFAVGVLAVLIVLLTLLPSAQVRITPVEQTQEVIIPVSAAPANATVSLAGGVPAREIAVILEKTASVKSSGQLSQPVGRASGVVVLANLTENEVSVPAGSVVLNRTGPAVRFATTGAVKVPAGAGKTVEVPVEALQPGEAGNLPAGAIAAFESPLGLSLSVSNPAPTAGGRDKTQPAPTEADRARLRKLILEELQLQAQEQIKGQIQAGDVWFPSTLELAQTIEETFTPAVGQPGDELSLRLRAEFRAYYAASADLRQLAALTLDSAIPAGFSPKADATLALEPVTAAFTGPDGTTRWQLRASRPILETVDSYRAIMLVRGQSLQRASQLLSDEFSLSQPPSITIQPFFWKWLPFLPSRIEITR